MRIMGIYIKGISKLPEEEGITITIDKDGSVWVGNNESVLIDEAKAIIIQPHGNLIEKHDVFKLISAFPEIDKLLTVEFMTALYNLPTIIPTEESK